MIRSPICSVLGHVDHGKSSLLDSIRGGCIVKGEAGGITQAIGASIIPLETIKKKCGDLLEKLNLKFTIPGLLFIDTPGHEAFTSLRRRGGALADIAILVVDMNEGFKPQTIEAVEILKSSKTPFVIAANKLDLVPGWKPKPGKSLIESINSQSPEVITKVDQLLYNIVGSLYEKCGMNAERFDRVEDFTKQIIIVPCSAKTCEGIPNLIMVVTGLAQKYLEQCLTCNVKGHAKGTIMEIKEDKGMGKTADVIIYDGTLKVNDTVVIGGIDDAIVTKVRALFQPLPLMEMRDKKAKFKPVKEVIAATGVKISAPGMENAVAGMPLVSASTEEEIEAAKRSVQEEVAEILIETDKEGIVVKADNIGSLEALTKLLKGRGVMIRNASIGSITKKDIADAESNFEKDPLMSVIIGFNVGVPEDVVAPKTVKIMLSDIIYRLIEEYEQWKSEASKNIEAIQLEALARPCKLQIIPGYVFRQNNPAVAGVEVLAGKAVTGMKLMKDGKAITEIKSIQSEQKNLSEAEKGKKVAISMPNVTIGRQINEGDILYSAIPENDFRKLKGLKKCLKPDEIEAIKEIAKIMREGNSLWGV